MRRRPRPEPCGTTASVRTRSIAGASYGPVACATLFGCAPRAPSLSKRGSRRAQHVKECSGPPVDVESSSAEESAGSSCAEKEL